MTRKWRVAILGLGHWYSAYNMARGLREYSKAELVAVASPHAEHLAEFATTFGVTPYADCAELLEREDIDIVHIAAPVSEIPALTLLAAANGKHILLGKPMAMTLAQADEMVATVERAGVSCLAFQGIMRLRFAELKARIEKGEIGDIVRLHHTARWSIAEDWRSSGKPGWFADPAHVPGGALIDEGIYWLDFFRWLSGSEVVEVEARIANLVHKDIAVEDWGFASYSFANGLFATQEASWTISAPSATGPSPKHNSVVRLEVVGNRGEIIEQSFRSPGRAVLAAGANDWVFEQQGVPLFQPASPFPLPHLVECLERGTQPVATIQDARQTFRIALAAYESARTGTPVRISA